MNFNKILTSVAAMVLLAGSTLAADPFVLKTSTGLFTPTFRGDADTTWFAWESGSFFTTPPVTTPTTKRRLLNPQPTQGTVKNSDGVQLFQQNWTDTNAEVIGSSSNNIYKGGNGAGTKPLINLTLSAPTDGIIGSGFTTLIVQGTSLTGTAMGPATAFLAPGFGNIGSVAPDFTIATTDDNRKQFWVKYELPGNQSIYDINISLPLSGNSNPVSISGLSVDSYWSETSYAADTVVAPEPSTYALILISSVALVWSGVRRRKSAGPVQSAGYQD